MFISLKLCWFWYFHVWSTVSSSICLNLTELSHETESFNIRGNLACFFSFFSPKLRIIWKKSSINHSHIFLKANEGLFVCVQQIILDVFSLRFQICKFHKFGNGQGKILTWDKMLSATPYCGVLGVRLWWFKALKTNFEK